MHPTPPGALGVHRGDKSFLTIQFLQFPDPKEHMMINVPRQCHTHTRCRGADVPKSAAQTCSMKFKIHLWDPLFRLEPLNWGMHLTAQSSTFAKSQFKGSPPQEL